VGFLFGVKTRRMGQKGQSPGRFLDKGKIMGISEIRVEELKQRLDAGEDLFLLDVRDESEYEISIDPALKSGTYAA
jgi:hypothetical protein